MARCPRTQGVVLLISFVLIQNFRADQIVAYRVEVHRIIALAFLTFNLEPAPSAYSPERDARFIRAQQGTSKGISPIY